MMMNIRSRIALVIGLAGLASCGGGGGGSSAVPSGAPAKAPANTVPVTFTIVIPRPTGSSASRHQQYISASTASATVTVNAGGPTSTPCTTTCTFTVDAPIGSDTFAVSLFDISSNLLSQGSTSATISPTIANSVSISFGGKVKKIQLASVVSHLVPGTLATGATITVTTLDADNNTIIGSDPYVNPVTLTNSDVSGATSLSTSTITSPATSSVAFNYSGAGALAGNTVTITPSATGAAGNTAVSFNVYAHHTILEYPIPSGAYPDSVASGPDGNLWFGQSGVSQVGYVTPSGTVQQFSTSGGIAYICAGSDGNMWFTEYYVNKIGRVTPAGVVTEFNVPTASAQPEGIASGTTYLYFAEFGSSNPGRLGKITLSGTITESAQIPTLPQLDNVALGPDNRMWVSEPFAYGTQMLDAFSQSTLSYTQYAIPGGAQLRNIVNGPLGDLWIIDAGNAKVDQVNTSGTFLNQFSVSDPYPEGLAEAVDGNLYFGGEGSNVIARLTTSGVETDFSIPTPSSGVSDVASGPDGNIWFAESTATQIGRFIL